MLVLTLLETARGKKGILVKEMGELWERGFSLENHDVWTEISSCYLGAVTQQTGAHQGEIESKQEDSQSGLSSTTNKNSTFQTPSWVSFVVSVSEQSCVPLTRNEARPEEKQFRKK